MYIWHWHWNGVYGIPHWIPLIFLTLYFLPALIAAIRRAQHGLAIAVLNLALGWTVIGWFATLIWAVVEQPRKVAP
jgi:hypothetical protein